jgi:hypothetical protein
MKYFFVCSCIADSMSHNKNERNWKNNKEGIVDMHKSTVQQLMNETSFAGYGNDICTNRATYNFNSYSFSFSLNHFTTTTIYIYTAGWMVHCLEWNWNVIYSPFDLIVIQLKMKKKKREKDTPTVALVVYFS